MSQFIDSEIQDPLQTQSNPAQPKNSSLKLVVSHSSLNREDILMSPVVPPPGFILELRHKGPQFYEMRLQDSSHALEATLFLDIENDQNGNQAVCCHFPNILDGKPSKFMDEEEILYSVAMIRFQLKIVEHLLLFSSNHQASELKIYLDDPDAEVLQIYRHFPNSEETASSRSEDEMEIILPITPAIMGKWADFMTKTNIKIGQQLWRRQRQSIVIRNYLKSHSFA